MKKSFFLVVIVLAAFTQSFAQSSILKRSYAIGTSGSVSVLKIDGNINVKLVIASNEPNVWIEGTEDFIKSVQASIINGTMTISAGTSSKSENDVVLIYVPTLSRLELNGDIQLKTIGTINAENLQVNINGICKLSVQHAGKLSIKLDDEYEFTEKKTMRLKTS